MVKHSALVFSVVLLMAPAIHAAEPATNPAGGGAVAGAADYSEPRKTVASFLTAVQGTDPGPIKRAIVATADQEPVTNTIIALWVAQAKLRVVAESAFGSQAAGPFFGTVGSQMESRLKAIQDAPMKLTEESAILTVPADDTNHPVAGNGKEGAGNAGNGGGNGGEGGR